MTLFVLTIAMVMCVALVLIKWKSRQCVVSREDDKRDVEDRTASARNTDGMTNTLIEGMYYRIRSV